jgi:hypothetical protein
VGSLFCTRELSRLFIISRGFIRGTPKNKSERANYGGPPDRAGESLGPTSTGIII